MARSRRLKIACIEAGLTQRQVAETVGIDEWKLSRIVNGKQVVDDATKAAIASALGRSVAELFPSVGHDGEVSTLTSSSHASVGTDLDAAA